MSAAIKIVVTPTMLQPGSSAVSVTSISRRGLGTKGLRGGTSGCDRCGMTSAVRKGVRALAL
jgi:hypothetical protein